MGKRKGREGFLTLLQLGVQQKEAKSSVRTGVAGSETWQKLSLFLVLLLEWPVLGTSFFSVYSIGLCEKERDVDLRGAFSMLSLASMLRSCQSCPGSKSQLKPNVPHGLLLSIKAHEKELVVFYPTISPCDTHAQDSLTCQASCRHSETFLVMV